eukprot:4765213-Prymnesium_polylepis.1
MLVPAAHGLVGLGSGAALVSALQAIGWHGNPFFLPPAEFEAVRQAALLVCLLPTLHGEHSQLALSPLGCDGRRRPPGSKDVLCFSAGGQSTRLRAATDAGSGRLPARDLLSLRLVRPERKPGASYRANLVARGLSLRGRCASPNSSTRFKVGRVKS